MHLSTLLRAGTLAALLSAIALAGKHERDWQTGRVLDTDRSQIYLGTTGDTTTAGTIQGKADAAGNISGTYSGSGAVHQRAKYATQEHELIEGDQYVYLVARVLHWRWSKASNLTVNAPVRFAVEKHSMYVLDDDGREHKTQIVKRILKTTDPLTAPK